MNAPSILAADPDPLQRQVLDMLLGVGRFEAIVVASGAEALTHLRERTPEAIVLATDLGDVAGSVVCRKVKAVKRLARVPVVLVAPEPNPGATLDEAVRREAREAGADLLLQKPLGDKNLRERIERLLAVPANDISVSVTSNSGVFDGPASFGGDANELGMLVGGVPAASELGGLRAEVARLRHENEALKARLAKVKERNEALQTELEAARRPRGLFGRRG